jgi:uncharacterized membrane protein
MLVAFPISGAFGTAFCDVAWWWTGDFFWARAALWAKWRGLRHGHPRRLVGACRAAAGAGRPPTRCRLEPRGHRHGAARRARRELGPPAAGSGEAILPWGLLLSGLALLLVAVTGWHGGKLVFEHQVGVSVKEDDRPA